MGGELPIWLRPFRAAVRYGAPHRTGVRNFTHSGTVRGSVAYRSAKRVGARGVGWCRETEGRTALWYFMHSGTVRGAVHTAVRGARWGNIGQKGYRPKSVSGIVPQALSGYTRVLDNAEGGNL